MKEVIEQIKIFADKAHGEQMRKYSNERYIVHPIRVMETCKDYSNDISILSAALLHDVLEDTPVTEEEIRQFLDGILSPQETLQSVKLVKELTDIYTKKNYPALNRRQRKEKEFNRLAHVSAEAQTIKYADLIDNVTNIAENDPDFASVFVREGISLLKKMMKGNSVLYNRALSTLEACSKDLKLTANIKK